MTQALSLIPIAALGILLAVSIPTYAQTPYDLMDKKRCSELFPNLLRDYSARNECIGEVGKRIEKQKASDRAEAEREWRENAARTCIANDIGRVEQQLDSIKNNILSDFKNKISEESSYTLSRVTSLLKERFPNNLLSGEPAKDNIKEKVLIFRVSTTCNSDFYFLANIRAGVNDELLWYKLWPQNTPIGYEVSSSRLNNWGLDFEALKKEQELLSAVAQPGQKGWSSDSKTGCKIWNQAPRSNETVTWTGVCKNGFADGYGATTWLINNIPNRILKRSYKDGYPLDGQVESTNLDSNNVTNGTLKDNKWDGNIRVTDLNGNLKYEGVANDSKLHGYGTLIMSDKTKYVGNFAFGNKDGSGSLYDSNGRLLYEGTFSQNMKSGAGHLFFQEGSYFDGNFDAGYMNGSGMIHWVNGSSTYVTARNGCAWAGTKLLASQKPKSQCKLERGLPE